MKIAILSPVAWRTPPRRYGPWEQVASTVAEGLVEEGLQVTLFATGDSHTNGKLASVIPQGYEENRELDAKVCECLHISHLMERADQFDLVHNHFDFLPLTYSALISTPMVTTIHGFSSPRIIEVYKKYNSINYYVSISYANRAEQLNYVTNIYHGIDPGFFTYNPQPDEYLLYFGRIHQDKGTFEAIQIARQAGFPLIISGLIQDQQYFQEKVMPWLGDNIKYLGNANPAKRDFLLGNAKALIHPINFDEPFGLSVVEAMTCGTPVVAFNRGSMQELIVPQKTGFLVDNVHQAVEVIPDINLIERSACRNWALSQFSKNKMVQGYKKLFQQVLANKRGKVSQLV